MDEREDVVVVHDAVFEVLEQRQDEFLLAGVLQDELEQMAGEVEGVPASVVQLVL